MLKTYEREKLLNAIIYFAENTANCGKTKLFKLLFLLDLNHYQQTGRTITGMDYYAWQLGPVPADLDNELESEEVIENSIWEAIELKAEWAINYTRLRVVPKKQFNSEYFTKRELAILAELAQHFGQKTAKEMVDITHEEDGVWAKVFNGGNGKYERIPFELTLQGESAARILDKSKEHDSLKNYFETLSHC